MRPTADGEALERALLEAVGYAGTRACELLDESPAYGPLRLLEPAKRTIDAMEAAGIRPAGVLELRTNIDAARASMIEGEDAFRAPRDALVGEGLRLA
jgi:hypothetical protein